ncbi:hypothetical protein [Facklamia hominis]|uniref:Uncharacterized protein n=1 Tax=Facklamia hominis CCUG 36813 TaxID=883111 RepID=K1LIL9_9LACT|nr:hypothetical protein [Facklamia hominis]EKB54496.1 hypothetical protein HMPREF9706_00686 [Facklamia hominis CCUG 36813]
MTVKRTDKNDKVLEQELKKVQRETREKKSEFEDKLAFINYKNNGSVVFTNGYVAVLIEDYHEEKDLELADFPAVEKFFDIEKNDYSVINFDSFKALKNTVQLFSKHGSEYIFMSLDQGTFNIRSVNPGYEGPEERHKKQFELGRALTETPPMREASVKISGNPTLPFTFKVKASYLADCFMFFNKLGIDKGQILYRSAVQPFTICSDNVYYLICPIRTVGNRE